MSFSLFVEGWKLSVVAASGLVLCGIGYVWTKTLGKTSFRTRFAGKTVWITGASSGIGEEMVRASSPPSHCLAMILAHLWGVHLELESPLHVTCRSVNAGACFPPRWGEGDHERAKTRGASTRAEGLYARGSRLRQEGRGSFAPHSSDHLPGPLKVTSTLLHPLSLSLLR